MQAYRRLPLAGLLNARDLGGYAFPGGVTHFGVFVRADVPTVLSDADLGFLRDYGLTTVVDLRGNHERRKTPDLFALVPWVHYQAIPLYDKTAAHGECLEGRTFSWADHYIRMAEQNMDWLRAVLEALAEAPGCALFHCATGKDRTGLVAAALLGLCGVSDADIAADYSLSRIYLSPLVDAMYRAGRISSPEDPFFSTQPENMLNLLAHIRATHGGMAEYLRACGLSAETLSSLRERLISPDA